MSCTFIESLLATVQTAGPTHDEVRDMVNELNRKLKHFVMSPKSEDGCHKLMRDTGLSASGLLWLLSTESQKLTPTLKSLDTDLAYETIEVILNYQFYRDNLVLDALRIGGDEAHKTLSILEITVASSAKLCELIADKLILDLITVTFQLSDNHTRRLNDLLLALLNHDEMNVSAKFCRSVVGSDNMTIIEWAFTSAIIRELAINSLNGAAESTLKGRKNKNIQVEKSLRLYCFMQTLGYRYLRDVDAYTTHMKDLVDSLWRLGKAGDPLTTLNVFEVVEEANHRSTVMRMGMIMCSGFPMQIFTCFNSCDPFQDIVRSQMLRLLSVHLNGKHIQEDNLPEIKMDKDSSPESEDAMIWRYYVKYIKYCLDSDLPDGSERDELIMLAFDCWGIACAGGNGYSIGLFEEYVFEVRTLATKIFTMRGIHANVILSSLHAWMLIMTGPQSPDAQRLSPTRLDRSVKREGDMYYDHMIHYVIDPLVQLMLDKPFEELRTKGIQFLTQCLSFENAMKKIVSVERLMTLFRVPNTQPVLYARFDFIKTLLLLYSEKEIHLVIKPDKALVHFKEMSKSGSYAFIAAEVRNGDVSVLTE